jgi:hypothetical protein
MISKFDYDVMQIAEKPVFQLARKMSLLKSSSRGRNLLLVEIP